MKKLFEKQEITLLLGSTVIDDYPELRTAMMTCPDIYDNELYKLPRAVQTLFPGEYARLVSAAEKDWTSIVSDNYPVITVGEDPNHNRCELCGNSQCDRLYPIQNLKADTIKYVGSTCIGRFNIAGKESVIATEARHRALKKFHELNMRFPGIVDNYMHGAQSKAETASHLIPNPLYKEYQDNFKRIRSLGEQFQAEEDGDTLNQITDQIQRCLIMDKNYCARIDAYCEEAKDNWLIPNRKMIERMRSRKKTASIQKIRNENGIISAATLKDVDEVDFMNTYILPNIQEITKDMPITFCRIWGVNAGGYGVNATALPIKENHPHFFIQHVDIAKEFGQQILLKSPIKSKKRLLSLIRLTPDTPMIPLLRNAKKRLGYYSIFLAGVNEVSNDLFLSCHKNILRISLSLFVQSHIDFFVDPYGITLLNPIGFLRQHGDVITRKEWNDIISSSNKQADLYLFETQDI